MHVKIDVHYRPMAGKAGLVTYVPDWDRLSDDQMKDALAHPNLVPLILDNVPESQIIGVDTRYLYNGEMCTIVFYVTTAEYFAVSIYNNSTGKRVA